MCVWAVSEEDRLALEQEEGRRLGHCTAWRGDLLSQHVSSLLICASAFLLTSNSIPPYSCIQAVVCVPHLLLALFCTHCRLLLPLSNFSVASDMPSVATPPHPAAKPCSTWLPLTAFHSSPPNCGFATCHATHGQDWQHLQVTGQATYPNSLPASSTLQLPSLPPAGVLSSALHTLLYLTSLLPYHALIYLSLSLFPLPTCVPLPAMSDILCGSCVQPSTFLPCETCYTTIYLLCLLLFHFSKLPAWEGHGMAWRTAAFLGLEGLLQTRHEKAW